MRPNINYCNYHNNAKHNHRQRDRSMQIPTLTTNRLLLKSLVASDALQIQQFYPRWEIVQYMMSSVPWPYPDNGAEHYVNNIALPDMAVESAENNRQIHCRFA